MDTFILIVGLISIQAFLAAGLMILNDIRKMLRENDDGQDVLREENQQERRYDAGRHRCTTCQAVDMQSGVAALAKKESEEE